MTTTEHDPNGLELHMLKLQHLDRALAREQRQAELDNRETPEPHGWVTWWPRPGGGNSPVYSHGATKPSYGPELNELLRIYPVFTAD